MRRGRWYPTNTMLANGSVVILAGRDEVGDEVAEPEVWSSSGIRVLTNASLVLPYYPRTFLAPNGRVFYAGEQQTSRYLNTSGNGSWTHRRATAATAAAPTGPRSCTRTGRSSTSAAAGPPTRPRSSI